MASRLLSIAVFLHFFQLIVAQNLFLSNKGRFGVEFIKGCTPFTINITELDTFQSFVREYRYGTESKLDTFHTFQSAGIFQILQLINIPDESIPRTDTLLVEVLAPTEPRIEVERCENSEISFKSTDGQYDFIRIYPTANDSIELNRNESETFRFDAEGVQQIRLKGFYTHADEICRSYFTTVNTRATITPPLIQSADLKETCRDLFSLSIEIGTYDPRVRHEVKFIQADTFLLFEGLFTTDQLMLSDIPFVRQIEEYCLKINAINTCLNSTIQGVQSCFSPSVLSLTPFENLYSTYVGNNIQIQLDSLQSGSFLVYRKSPNSTFEFRDTTTTSLLDPIGSAARKYFYRIDYADSCGEVLSSMETNPPFIDLTESGSNKYLVSLTEPKNTLNQSTRVKLNAGSENNNTSVGVTSNSYEIALNAQNGAERQGIWSTYFYDSGETLRSNTELVKYDFIIYVPNAFTPNGDGLNDTLAIFGLPTEQVTITIYNRWGDQVYSSNSPASGWDGTINGERAPQGTYLYDISFEAEDGVILRQKGTFVIIN